jgi:hypothetical protein
MCRIVLTSLMTTLMSGRRKKSTRAIASQPSVAGDEARQIEHAHAVERPLAGGIERDRGGIRHAPLFHGDLARFADNNRTASDGTTVAPPEAWNHVAQPFDRIGETSKILGSVPWPIITALKAG